MTLYEVIIKQHFDKGRADALNLRTRSTDMTGTEIIAEERKTPLFKADKDYSAWDIGSPIRELIDGEYQVFKLLQPYNAANYTGTPKTLPALWSICHTKDQAKAKLYQAPNGTSGMYMQDEVCIKDGKRWRSIQDNNPYPPNEAGAESFWTEI